MHKVIAVVMLAALCTALNAGVKRESKNSLVFNGINERIKQALQENKHLEILSGKIERKSRKNKNAGEAEEIPLLIFSRKEAQVLYKGKEYSLKDYLKIRPAVKKHKDGEVPSISFEMIFDDGDEDRVCSILPDHTDPDRIYQDCRIKIEINKELASFDMIIYEGSGDKALAYLWREISSNFGIKEVLNIFVGEGPYVQLMNSYILEADLTEYSEGFLVLSQYSNEVNGTYYLLKPGEYRMEVKGEFLDGEKISFLVEPFNLKYYNDYKGQFPTDGSINSEKIAEAGIKYYNNALHINTEKGGEYFVYSVDGRLVQSGKFAAGDSEIGINLRAGAYVAKIQTKDNKTKIVKFTVVR
jgi:hypothetical protein